MDEKLYNAKEACAKMHISLSLLYKIAKQKRIRSVRIGALNRRGKVLIPESAIEEFLSASAVAVES